MRRREPRTVRRDRETVTFGLFVSLLERVDELLRPDVARGRAPAFEEETFRVAVRGRVDVHRERRDGLARRGLLTVCRVRGLPHHRRSWLPVELLVLRGTWR